MTEAQQKTEQDRAREAADVWKVLDLFVRDQENDPGLSWSVLLVAREARLEEARALRAVTTLVRWRCLAACYGGLYKLTQEGLEAYHGALRSPALFDATEWIWTARTGMAPDGKKTTIENAVIPTREVRTPSPADLEPDPLANHHVAKMVSEELGVTYARAVAWIEQGKVFKCPGFGRGPHMARENDRHKLCAACAKRKDRNRE